MYYKIINQNGQIISIVDGKRKAEKEKQKLKKEYNNNNIVVKEIRNIKIIDLI